MSGWHSIWAKKRTDHRAVHETGSAASRYRPLASQFAYNGDGVRTSKTVAGETTEYALDLLATLPVVISDTKAVYLYGLDIIAQQQAIRRGWPSQPLHLPRQAYQYTTPAGGSLPTPGVAPGSPRDLSPCRGKARSPECR